MNDNDSNITEEGNKKNVNEKDVNKKIKGFINKLLILFLIFIF